MLTQSKKLSYKVMTIAIGHVVYQSWDTRERLSFLVYVPCSLAYLLPDFSLKDASY